LKDRDREGERGKERDREREWGRDGRSLKRTSHDFGTHTYANKRM